MVTEVEHPLLGKMPIVNTPFVLSETPRQVQGPAPFLGQHNAEVLTQHLGYSAADVARLAQAGVLVEEEKVKGLRERGVI
jgi:crotonobetainyl-CoA:carnitine CoA-transferase CaiB-like acyl-CoA transferase